MPDQLELFEPEMKPIDLDANPFPFRARYYREDFSHCGLFIDHQDGEFIFSAFFIINFIYSDYFTNRVKFTRWPACRLPYDFYRTNEERTADIKQSRPEAKQRKKRKPYKWSREAKARNRRKRLKQRIQKKHGFDPNQSTLFQEELLSEIDFEYQMTIAKQPEYYAGEDVDFF